jgi:hypothetical protein
MASDSKLVPNFNSVFMVGTYILINNFGKLNGKKTNTYGVWEKDMRQDQYVAGPPLGTITWLSRWRKYAFNPAPNCSFEEICMGEISEFIKNETAHHYATLKTRKAAA